MKSVTVIMILNIFCATNLSAMNVVEVEIPYKIKNFSLSKCDNNPQPLSFENVSIQTRNNDLAVSGIMITTLDLTSPMQVSVILKRKIFGIWVKVPCLNKVGSCTYEDACQFGVAGNEACPTNFEKNNFPCRCPIVQGTYEMTDDVLIPKKLFQKFWTSGKYWGVINVKENSKQIGCYTTRFTLI